jgi:hypothetical protein
MSAPRNRKEIGHVIGSLTGQPIVGVGKPETVTMRSSATLKEVAALGISLSAMGKLLSVSAQRVQQRLLMDERLYIEWKRARQLRGQQQRKEVFKPRTEREELIAAFCHAARRRGWSVVTCRQRRPEINGAKVAFHLPSAARPRRKDYPHLRYFEVRISRPDFLNVVRLPSGRHLVYLPGSLTRGPLYIAESKTLGPHRWPRWDCPSVASGKRKVAAF